MKVEPIIHVIVGAAEWGHDRLRYRRHRLAEFLARQKKRKASFGYARPREPMMIRWPGSPRESGSSL